MNEFHIEKVRQRVSVTLLGGVTIAGDLFLQPTARYRVGPQDPADLLEEPDAFLPLAPHGDELVMLAKEHIVHVQYPTEPADTHSTGAPDAVVEVFFTDGTSVAGTLRVETPTGRRRLLDFLNMAHQRFLRLETRAGVCLVNRRQIAQVREQA